MKKFINKHIYGILGTIIVHLIIAIIFMTVKLTVTFKDNENFVWIEFESSREDKPLEVKEEKIEQPEIYDESKYWSTIAANISNEIDEEFDIDEYMEQLKNELIESGDIEEKTNYIDDRNEIERNLREGITSYAETNRSEEIMEEEKKSSSEIASNYRGPTRIYYELEGRVHKNLILPIYLCEGAGKVVVDIIVNQKGEVERSEINDSKTEIINECLFEAAIKAASGSTFNINISAPNLQAGTITYHFKAQ